MNLKMSCKFCRRHGVVYWPAIFAPSCSAFVRDLVNVFTHKAEQNQNHTLRGYRLRRSVHKCVRK